MYRILLSIAIVAISLTTMQAQFTKIKKATLNSVPYTNLRAQENKAETVIPLLP